MAPIDFTIATSGSEADAQFQMHQQYCDSAVTDLSCGVLGALVSDHQPASVESAYNDACATLVWGGGTTCRAQEGEVVSDPATWFVIDTISGAWAGRLVGAFRALRSGIAGTMASRSAATSVDDFFNYGGEFLDDAIRTTPNRVPAVGEDLLAPGPWAERYVPSSGPGRITAAERRALNPIGDEFGCHSCGTTNNGVKSGNWVGDHMPISSAVPAGTPQVLYPHCQQCSNDQGLYILDLIRKGLWPPS